MRVFVVATKLFQNTYFRVGRVPLTNLEVIEQLSFLRTRSGLILYMVDLCDIEGTIINNIQDIIGSHNKIILVGTKIDRLPAVSICYFIINFSA